MQAEESNTPQLTTAYCCWTDWNQCINNGCTELKQLASISSPVKAKKKKNWCCAWVCIHLFSGDDDVAFSVYLYLCFWLNRPIVEWHSLVNSFIIILPRTAHILFMLAHSKISALGATTLPLNVGGNVWDMSDRSCWISTHVLYRWSRLCCCRGVQRMQDK